MTQRTHAIRSPFFYTAALLLSGCSDHAPAAHIDQSARFEDLSAARVDDLCREANHFARDEAYASAVCTAFAAGVAALSGLPCTELRSPCLHDPPPPCALWGLPDDVDVACPDATVSMYLDCIQGNIRRVKERYAGAACEARTDLDYFGIAELAQQVNDDRPPECAAFRSTCPAFFEVGVSM